MRVAVVGCGAIADSFHLPALLGIADEKAIVLVDPNRARAAALGSKYGIASILASHEELPGRVDAAIVATPHHLHFPVASALLESGVPVLVEKPLGTSVKEVEALAELSRRTGLPLAVNQTRRFIPACREIARLLASGDLGEMASVDAREGDRFDWPAVTPSMFGRRSGGKGVLLDIGVHVLDLVTWWFGDGVAMTCYRDDSFGGSEAAAHVSLAAGRVPIEIRLSWLVKQRNSYRFVGSEATLEWRVYDLDILTLQSNKTGHRRTIRLAGAPGAFADLAPLVLSDFLGAVRNGTRPTATPESVLPAQRIIEACYARRTTFAMPWHRFERA